MCVGPVFNVRTVCTAVCSICTAVESTSQTKGLVIRLLPGRKNAENRGLVFGHQCKSSSLLYGEGNNVGHITLLFLYCVKRAVILAKLLSLLCRAVSSSTERTATLAMSVSPYYVGLFPPVRRGQQHWPCQSVLTMYGCFHQYGEDSNIGHVSQSLLCTAVSLLCEESSNIGHITLSLLCRGVSVLCEESSDIGYIALFLLSRMKRYLAF